MMQDVFIQHLRIEMRSKPSPGAGEHKILLQWSRAAAQRALTRGLLYARKAALRTDFERI